MVPGGGMAAGGASARSMSPPPFPALRKMMALPSSLTTRGFGKRYVACRQCVFAAAAWLERGSSLPSWRSASQLHTIALSLPEALSFTSMGCGSLLSTSLPTTAECSRNSSDSGVYFALAN